MIYEFLKYYYANWGDPIAPFKINDREIDMPGIESYSMVLYEINGEPTRAWYTKILPDGVFLEESTNEYGADSKPVVVDIFGSPVPQNTCSYEKEYKDGYLSKVKTFLNTEDHEPAEYTCFVYNSEYRMIVMDDFEYGKKHSHSIERFDEKGRLIYGCYEIYEKEFPIIQEVNVWQYSGEKLVKCIETKYNQHHSNDIRCIVSDYKNHDNNNYWHTRVRRRIRNGKTETVSYCQREIDYASSPTAEKSAQKFFNQAKKYLKEHSDSSELPF